MGAPGHGLACQRRSIYHRRSFKDRAVHRNLFARFDDQYIAGFDLVRVYRLDRTVFPLHVSEFRRYIHQLTDGFA